LVVLITGSTGFIGKRLVNKLQSSGYQLRVISRNPVPGIETFIADLKGPDIPSEALSGVDTIFHLAGYAHDLREAAKMREIYYSINVDSTFRLAELAIQNKVKRFIFVSSVKAGGPPIAGHCISEEEQGEPEGVYGKTKREAELKLLKVASKHMHVSIVRPSLVYGPNAKGNLRLMLSGIKKGWFPPLPEIVNRRSMIHVDDLVRALLFVAEDSRANGEIFNATDGIPHSSREIYEAMCSVLVKSIPKWSVPKFFFSIASFMNPRIRYKVNKLLGDECYSSEKLQSLGFKPKRSLNEMNETSY
jgi:nucleoside-diphosphate-sugar epimerase